MRIWGRGRVDDYFVGMKWLIIIIIFKLFYFGFKIFELSNEECDIIERVIDMESRIWR